MNLLIWSSVTTSGGAIRITKSEVAFANTPTPWSFDTKSLATSFFRTIPSNRPDPLTDETIGFLESSNFKVSSNDLFLASKPSLSRTEIAASADAVSYTHLTLPTKLL
jgi:hypothetical protein